MFFASPSKLGVWRQCRRRYKFRYVDRLPQKAWPWNAFGRSVHAALRELFDLRPENRTWERLERFLRRNWVSEGYADAEDEARSLERAVTGLRRYYDADPDVRRVPRPRALEFNVEDKIGDVVLQGKVDRIDETDDGLVLIDYKTGRPRQPEEAQADFALTMYALLMRARYKRPPVRLVWDFVEHGTKVSATREPAALDRAKAEVLSLVAEVRADTEFPPNPGPMCRTCDYLELCPEGQAAVAAYAPGVERPGFVGEPPIDETLFDETSEED